MNSGIVELDIHGLNKRQAKNLIDSRLRTASKGLYRLRIIHGYRMGTELREMVRSVYKKHPKVIRLELNIDPGVTDLVLKELFKS